MQFIDKPITAGSCRRFRLPDIGMLAVALAALVPGTPAAAQGDGGNGGAKGVTGPPPYQFTSESWLPPFAAPGFSWGGNSGVHVQSAERIFFIQRGETALPDPLPEDYAGFPGSMGWNVLRGRGRVWQNCIYVVNSAGEVLEVWDQWDHLFAGTDGPGPHRIRISPYDPEQRVWVVDETGHIIYVFSNDGSRLLMTLGEKNVPGAGETRFSQPQDVAFLPDGKILVADGLGNKRIVVRHPDGSFHSQFGEPGEQPHRFASVHTLALGPGQRLYAVDRDNANIKVFQQTAAADSAEYPRYALVDVWEGFEIPLHIQVSEDRAWVTDLRPPRVIQLDLTGESVYTFNLPVDGPHMWIEMHAMAVDAAGNLYGTDNQAGRPQKLAPRPGANPDHLVGPAYVP